jgi:hypothetical protein
MPQVNLPSFTVPLALGLETVDTLASLTGVNTGRIFRDTVGYRFPRHALKQIGTDWGEDYIASIRNLITTFVNRSIGYKIRAWPDCVFFLSNRTGRVGTVWVANRAEMASWSLGGRSPSGSYIDMWEAGAADYQRVDKLTKEAFPHAMQLNDKAAMERWLTRDSMAGAMAGDASVRRAVLKRMGKVGLKAA